MLKREMLGTALVVATVFGVLGGVVGFWHGREVAREEGDLVRHLLLAEQASRFAQKSLTDPVAARRMAESGAIAGISALEALAEAGIKPTRYLALEPLIKRLESIFSGREYHMRSVERLREVQSRWYPEAI